MPKLSGPMLAPQTGAPPRRAVVLLHGYGADGADLIDLGRHWAPLVPDALFVAPNAPAVCAQNPSGFQWFALDVDRIAGRIAGIPEAAPVIREFLDDLRAGTGIATADTFLIGFSQGAMMALHVGTSMTERLAGIIAFSGALVPHAEFGDARFAKPPVALIHGDRDQVVDPQLSRDAKYLLDEHRFDARLHISPGVGHGIAPDGLDFASSFIAEQIG